MLPSRSANALRASAQGPQLRVGAAEPHGYWIPEGQELSVRRRAHRRVLCARIHALLCSGLEGESLALGLGPVGPVGVGGVIGPVGVDPVVDAAVRYAIPYGYPLGPAFPGELPCFTPAGQPYYTPYLEPCLCFAPTGDVVPC